MKGTLACSERLAKLVAWYDNEWGCSCRLADLAKMIHDRASGCPRW
jgi:glyceraldehyde 3-phosphate dehydrogenase